MVHREAGAGDAAERQDPGRRNEHRISTLEIAQVSSSQEGKDLAALLERDLKKLGQQVAGFHNDAQLWQTLPGVENCAGNLVLHLEGNLREYVGRQLGGIAYTRVRPAEFSTKDAPAAELSARVEELIRIVPPVLAGLSSEKLAA